MKALEAIAAEAPQIIRLDLGCGTRKKEGFTGVDSRPFDGVDVVFDLGGRYGDAVGVPVPRIVDIGRFVDWPWENNSVDEVHCSHMLEHLTAPQRIHFVNELHRVLKPGAKAAIITPHWASSRAYGDLTHQWPPVAEFWYFYLNAEWRKVNAPHNDGYTCDFDATWGYGLHPSIQLRNQEYQNHAVTFFKEAAQDIWGTITKRG